MELAETFDVVRDARNGSLTGNAASPITTAAEVHQYRRQRTLVRLMTGVVRPARRSWLGGVGDRPGTVGTVLLDHGDTLALSER
jgi:hypothetical protein